MTNRPRTTIDKPRLAVLAMMLWSLIASGCWRTTAQACSPFGNPPAQLYLAVTPDCGKGVRVGPWKDGEGTARFACLYEPAQAARAKPLPLVVYLHPSLMPAGSVASNTNLLDYLASANLSGDPARPGFIVLAPQGRDTHHYYGWPDERGPGWDNWYRQFSPDGDLIVDGKRYAENVDGAAIDYFIAAEVATGKVDRDRIYLTGWSNGAAMAYAYGLSRPKIAAIAVYSAPDPYETIPDVCFQKPVTTAPTNDSELRIFSIQSPTYQVHNNCDIAGLCPNALRLDGQLRALGGDVTDTIIDQGQTAVDKCDDSCGTNPDGDPNNLNATSLGVSNHIRWPTKWTPAMLDFFRRNPLNN
jgi:poly(3-hydroxybutyrate) depolymerase